MLRTHIITLFALVLFAAPVALATQVAPPPGAPQSFAELSQKLLPAVVNISTTQKSQATIGTEGLEGQPDMGPELPEFPEGSPFKDFFDEFMDKHGQGMPNIPQASLGSGFIIDEEKKLVITNNHVIRDAEEIRVILHDDTTIDAELLGHDEKTDLALLKLKTDKKLTAVKFGDSDVMRVGDWVLAIGNPFGLGGTVTAGIISARKRDIKAGPYDDFIQTDASINRGNSGGPMFNLEGEVIGINTAIFSPSGGSVGIGFAIPSSLAKPVIDQLQKYGKTRRGWIGVRIQSVTPEIAETLGMKEPVGALVASITEKGPADSAGLKAGDVITTFNGQEVKDMRALPRLVAETEIGSKATVTYLRGGKKGDATIAIGELEKAEEQGLLTSTQEAEPQEESGTIVKPLGLTVAPLNDNVRKFYGIGSSIKGVIITKVDTASDAAEKGLATGDVIVEVNQQSVTSAEQVEKAVEAAVKDKRTSVLMLVDQQASGNMQFVAVKLKK